VSFDCGTRSLRVIHFGTFVPHSNLPINPTASEVQTMAQLPLARRTGLIVEQLPTETLVYDSDRDKAMCLNQAAASVWKYCDGKTTPARMARLIEKELQITGGDEVVSLALERLEKAHLLAGKAPVHLPGMSRREMVGRLATVPVIAMILVPPAGQVGSCTPNEGSCVSNTDCCSGCCSDATCVPNNICFQKQPS
jgi:hypothetical protein